jgi:uncharacterized protein YndB with AHSA1/START domain
MTTTAKTSITIQATVKAPIEKIWSAWSEPKHITTWCTASDDWHAPKAENDLRVGGKFSTTMAAKDGSFSFDFSGVYTTVKPNTEMAYTLDDGRQVRVVFSTNGDTTTIVETFEAEDMNPIDMQRAGWQAILDNFKKYAEQL